MCMAFPRALPCPPPQKIRLYSMLNTNLALLYPPCIVPRNAILFSSLKTRCAFQGQTGLREPGGESGEIFLSVKFQKRVVDYWFNLRYWLQPPPLSVYDQYMGKDALSKVRLRVEKHRTLGLIPWHMRLRYWWWKHRMSAEQAAMLDRISSEIDEIFIYGEEEAHRRREERRRA